MKRVVVGGYRKIINRYQTEKRAFPSSIFDLSPFHKGEYIFDREWEVLIILDACRPDAIREVEGEYEFLSSDFETLYSVGSNSRIWMEKNFTSNFSSVLRQTAYVTGNPYSESYIESDELFALDEVWRYGWDEDTKGMPARPITERAVAMWRQQNPSRMLVHYMQPHFPSFPMPLDSGTPLDSWGSEWDSVWDKLDKGQISKTKVWESYISNVKYVIDDVKILLNNLSADSVVISADHGNAFGEFGFYGHPPDIHIPCLRRVPWIDVNAQDLGTLTPEMEYERSDTSARQRLKELGYLSGACEAIPSQHSPCSLVW